MARSKNLVLYPKTQTEMSALKADYEFIGREVNVVNDVTGKKLIVLALPRMYKKKADAIAKAKAKRETDNEDDRY